MARLMIEGSIPYMREIKGLEQFEAVDYIENAELTAEHLKDTDAMIVRSITKCNENLLRGTKVQFIATATAGFDHIDKDYCSAHQIDWQSAKGCNAIAVAQYVFSALSHLSLGDKWNFSDKTIGIIGVGCVGKEVEKIATALGMKVLRNDPPRAEQEGQSGFVSLKKIQEEADIITLHVPLSRDGNYPTYQMIGLDFLKGCKQKPILINACRGDVTPSYDLLVAKTEGLISRLVIDCWENEPVINKALLNEADLVSPHIAGFSAEGKLRGGRMCLSAVCERFGIEIDGLMDTSVLPEPEVEVIESKGKDDEFIARCFLHTLNPVLTDKALRNEAEAFEKLRKAYVYPREMSAYKVRANNAELRKKLQDIGFGNE